MFVTSFLRKQIKARGLESPLGLGRIWRVVPDRNLLNATPDLTAMTSDELVSELTDGNGTIRDIAQRLLTESSDESVVPLLEDIVKNAKLDRDRIKALWTLQGMRFLNKELVFASLEDIHPMVRTNAIRLSEPWMNDNDVFNEITSLQEDPNFYVRRQVALSVGMRQGPQAIFYLLDQLGKKENVKYRSAAIASLMGREHEALDLISLNATLKDDSPLNRQTLATLVNQMLSEKRASTNVLLLEFATKQAIQHAWQTKTVVDAILEKQKGSQLRLTRKPSRYQGLFTVGDQELYDSAVALHALLWWHGRTDVQEFIPKRVDQSVAQLITRGKIVYNICKTCHQVNGLGLPPTYPPLVDSPFVLDDKNRLIKIMLHGLSGPLTRDGRTYDESMPPSPLQNDYDIAAVMTYIRQAWGNNADAITPPEVKAMREKYKDRKKMWTTEELEN
jgi:mono/diheme cytochrome c family protein/HEAT repeat protein